MSTFPKKQMTNLLLSAICLALCILMFVFAFLPICEKTPTPYTYNSMELSSLDIMDIMFATTKQYDETDDEQAILAMQKECEQLFNEYCNCTKTYTFSTPNNHTNYYKSDAKAQKAYNKYQLTYTKMEYSIQGHVPTSNIVIMATLGILSLLYIIFISVLLIICTIAFVFNIINLQPKNKDHTLIFKFSKYYNLLIIPLFISLAILLGASAYYGNIAIKTEFIFRLLIECIAVAIVFTQLIISSNKNKSLLKKSIFKIATIALAIIACGCAFAPCLNYVAYREQYWNNTYGCYNNNITFNHQLNISIMNALDVSESQYYPWYANATHEVYVGGIIGNTSGYIIKDMFLDKKTLAYSSSMSTGSVAIIFTLLIFGGMAYCTLLDSKTGKLCSYIFGGLAVALVIVSLAFNITVCVTACKYISEFNIPNINVKLGGGLICSLIFTLGAFATILISKLKTNIYSTECEKQEQSLCTDDTYVSSIHHDLTNECEDSVYSNSNMTNLSES